MIYMDQQYETFKKHLELPLKNLIEVIIQSSKNGHDVDSNNVFEPFMREIEILINDK